MPRQGAIAALLLVLGLCGPVGPAAAAGPGDDAHRAGLLNLLKQDCGSCHGMTMKGGLGPALLPELISVKDIDHLVDTILDGRPGTPMPPWRPFLSRGDAVWMVEQLRRGLK